MVSEKEKLKRAKQKLHKVYMVTDTDQWTDNDFKIFNMLEINLHKEAK